VDRFVAEGARVAVLDRSEAGLEALRRDHGGRIAATLGDVRAIESNRDVVARCVEAFGQLDCAIANAGIWDYSRSLADLGDDAIGPAFDEVLAITRRDRCSSRRPPFPRSCARRGRSWSRSPTRASIRTVAALSTR
jgi:NAD(P)-dependent dehydrogenase (short-subunit alcohol dehydrogenase family)